MNPPETAEISPPEVGELMSQLNRLLENVGSVVLGKSEVIKLAGGKVVDTVREAA